MQTTGVLISLFALLAPLHAPDPPWRTLGPGLEFRRVEAAHGAPGPRKGPATVAVVRADPDRWRLDLFHRSEPSAEGRSRDADGWQRLTGATVVLNASQYYPDQVPMGIFLKQGRNLGTRLLPRWKGLLAAEPRTSGFPRVTILDLQRERFRAEASPWQVALQSFMLLDRNGRKRVRHSEWHASRSAAAIDRQGRLILLHTDGAWTLWDFADWMARSELRVREALSMDGGFEAQMCVRAGDFEYVSFGGWHVDDHGDHSLPGLRTKLPGVLALFPRR